MTPRGRSDLPFGARPSGFFALRTPLLTAATLAAVGRSVGASEAVGDALARSVDALREIVRRPEVREALFLGAPGLDAAVDAWLADPSSPRAQELTPTLLRYVIWMCLRPTPFGLFAGCSTGTLGASTALELADTARWRRHTRLDTHHVQLLCDALQGAPSLRGALRFAPNNALAATPSSLRYPEARVDPATRARSFHLVSVARDEVLDRALDAARAGATLGAVADALGRAGIARDEAADYVAQLVDAQLLVAELQPTVTGPSPLDHVAATLARAAPEAAETAAVEAVRAGIDALDARPLGAPAAAYHALVRILAELPAPAELARLFQVDLYPALERATLGGQVVREVAAALGALRGLCATAEPDELRRLREAFSARYEAREVPLLEALDEERGAFAALPEAVFSPWLDALRLDAEAPEAPPADPGLGWKSLRLGQLLREGAVAWSLTDEDLRALRVAEPAALPDAFAVLCSVRASGPEALDRGDFTLHLQGISGPSGARLLGRFCHGDPALRAHVEAHLRAEEALRPDALFAEVVHLPEGRLGNVVCRPVLRAHELAFLGRSGADPARQLALDDLVVSVREGRFVLRSVSLDREVIPRMSTAHHFALADFRLYRFLCLLQSARADFAWRWGALDAVAFLPRVTLGRTVLAPARWRLDRADLDAFRAPTPEARFAAVQGLRARRGLPRWVAWAEGDNVLSFDLDAPLFVEALGALLRKGSEAVLLEALQAPGAEVVSGPGGGFVHELVLPFVSSRAPSREVVPPRPPARAPRTFLPGSEWLYVKLYGSLTAAEQVLLEVVAPTVASARARGDLRRWFFLRYADPDTHLRARFQGDPERLLASVLPELRRRAAPLVESGALTRVELGTYEREVERYGGDDAMDLSEALFEADSDAALALVRASLGDAGAPLRGRLTLVGARRLLDDLEADPAVRAAILGRLRGAFAAEHRLDASAQAQLGQRFRAERAALEADLAGAAPDLAALEPVLEARSRAAQEIARGLRERVAPGPAWGSLLASHLHMHINRVTRARPRAHELVFYDLLARCDAVKRPTTGP